MKRRTRRALILVLTAVAAVLVGLCGVSLETTYSAMIDYAIKVSDTELMFRVEAGVLPEMEQSNYDVYYIFPDGVISPTTGYFYEYTLSNVSIDSFPMSMKVYFKHRTQPIDTFVDVSLDEFSSLFAPEIDLQAGSTSIPSGTTHHSRAQPMGITTLAYTIDNTEGQGDLVVSSITASNPENCDAISVLTPLPLTVPYGDSATLDVSITFDDPGDFSFELAVSSNDPDESLYSVDVLGYVMTLEEMALGGATQQLVPIGGGGDNAFLDQEPVLDGAGGAVMIGEQALCGVYEIGQVVTGAAMVCDPAMNPLRSSWIHVFAYSVDLSSRPEQLCLIDHWMVRYDHQSGCYALEWNTNEMSAGFYDIHLAIGDGRSETLRIRLEAP